MLSSALGIAAFALVLPLFGAAALFVGTLLTVKIAIFAVGVLFKLVMFGTIAAAAVAAAWGVARLIRGAG